MGWIADIVAETRKPRLVCICGDFALEDTPKPEFDFYQCRHCGGWMGADELLEQTFNQENP